MINNGGSGLFSVILLLIVFGLAAGFMFSQNMEMATQKAVASQALNQQGQMIATLAPQVTAAANIQAQLRAERDAALTARDNAIAERDAARLTSQQQTAEIQRWRTEVNQLLDDKRNLVDQVAQKDHEIADLQAKAQAQTDLQLPVTGGDAQPSLEQGISLLSANDPALILWGALGLVGTGLFSAYELLQRKAQRKAIKTLPAESSATVLVRMTREEAQQYARTRRGK